jgi:hypothetical protein
MIAGGAGESHTLTSTLRLDHRLREQQGFHRTLDGILGCVRISVWLPPGGDVFVHSFVQFTRIVSVGSRVLFDLHALKNSEAV